jgi:hypothetical protein
MSDLIRIGGIKRFHRIEYLPSICNRKKIIRYYQSWHGYVDRFFWEELKEYEKGSNLPESYVWQFNALRKKMKPSNNTQDYKRMAAFKGQQTLREWNFFDVILCNVGCFVMNLLHGHIKA